MASGHTQTSPYLGWSGCRSAKGPFYKHSSSLLCQYGIIPRMGVDLVRRLVTLIPWDPSHHGRGLALPSQEQMHIPHPGHLPCWPCFCQHHHLHIYKTAHLSLYISHNMISSQGTLLMQSSQLWPHTLRSHWSEPGVVVHLYNLSYSGGRSID
jgi:hypothetical protein